MIYLDHAATSWPKPLVVRQAVEECFDLPTGNYGRSTHVAAQRTTRMIHEVRQAAARLFNLTDPGRVIFTGNGTQALGLALRSLIPAQGKILVSPVEHDAVMKSLTAWVAPDRISMFRFPADCPEIGIGQIDIDWQDCRLLITSAISNVSGASLPWRELALEAQNRGIPCLIDGAQWAGKRPVNLRDLTQTVFCCSGHKGLMGPAGTGLLIRSERDETKPLFWGGTGMAGPRDPEYLEAGTPNIHGIAGMGAGIRLILETGPQVIEQTCTALTYQLKTCLRQFEALKPVGFTQNQCGIVSVNGPTELNSQILRWLDRKGFAIRGGLHCAPQAHRFYGTAPEGCLRFSIGYTTAVTELAALADTLSDFFSQRGSR